MKNEHPEEGVTRCWCGAKYWDGNRCASCGAKKELLRFDPNFPELMDALLACSHWYTFRDPEAGAWIVNEAPESALVCRECGGILRQLDIDLQAKGYQRADS